MSEKTSRIILSIEAILIVLPITVLALLESWWAIIGPNPQWHPPNIYAKILMWKSYYPLSKILILICLASLTSGWQLFFAFLRGGSNSLKKMHFGWWLLLLIGVLIFVGTLISISLPRTAGPSPIEEIQFFLGTFIFASPLLIPLIHLALEKFVRKPAGEIAK